MKIPSIKSRNWYTQQWIVEALAAGPPMVAGGITAWTAFSDKTRPAWPGWVLVGGLGWLLIASALKVRRAYQLDSEEAQRKSPADLVGPVHVLYSVLLHSWQSKPQDDGLRVTLLRVVPPMGVKDKAEYIEQVIPYVGGTGGGNLGRFMPIRAGIAGEAILKKRPVKASLEGNDGEAISEIIEKLRYDESEAKDLAGLRSWMAVPLISTGGDAGESVVGVIQLDAKTRGFFDSKERQDLVIEGCKGIASYLNERYP